jgi:hypothetical protein
MLIQVSQVQYLCAVLPVQLQFQLFVFSHLLKNKY